MENPQCSLPWCRQKGSHLTFEKFPDHEIGQLQWMALLDVAETWKDVPPDKLKEYLICNLHFDSRGNIMRASSVPLVVTAHVKADNDLGRILNRDPGVSSMPVTYSDDSAKPRGAKRRKLGICLSSNSSATYPVHKLKKDEQTEKILKKSYSKSNSSSDFAKTTTGSTKRLPQPAYKPKQNTRWTRESYSLDKKLEIVRMLQNGMTQKEVIAATNLRRSTVWSIWNNREKIEAGFMSTAPNRKKLRKIRFEAVDAALNQWYNSVVSQNVTVTGRLLQTMAETFAGNLGETDFVCTAGWLERFKQRHSIVLGTSKKKRSNADEVQVLEISPSVDVVEQDQLEELGSNDSKSEVLHEKNFLSDGLSNAVQIKQSRTADICQLSDSETSFGHGSDVVSSSGIISNKVGYREITSVVATDWIRHTWPKLRMRNTPSGAEPLDYYSAEDIYSAVEIGLLYKITPLQGWKMLKNRFQSPFNIAHERLTILACVNSDGSDKRRLCVYTQDKQPSCVMSVVGEDFSKLPVDLRYTSEPTSWLTEKEFGQWMQSWDNLLTTQSRQILLVVEALPMHNVNMTLRSIKIAPVPSHICHAVLPFFQGIAMELKSRYRRLQIERTIFYVEQSKTPMISLLDAIFMLSTAWNEITPNAIWSAFHSSGVRSGILKEPINTLYSFAPVEATSVITKAKSLGIEFPDDITFQDFVMADSCLFAVGVRSSTSNSAQNTPTELQENNVNVVDTLVQAYDEQNEAYCSSRLQHPSIIPAVNEDTREGSCKQLGHLQNPIAALRASEVQSFLDNIRLWSLSRSPTCPESVHLALSTLESFIHGHT